MIENIVRRSKKLAIKRVIGGGPEGVAMALISWRLIKQEYKEHEEGLPKDDEVLIYWAKIWGKAGRADRVHPHAVPQPPRPKKPHGGRAIERVATANTCYWFVPCCLVQSSVDAAGQLALTVSSSCRGRA